MDWNSVSFDDMIGALREVDWSTPPRPIPEFFSRFSLPRSSSYAHWNSRFKCNLYYYRTNYFILLMLVLLIGFVRRPLAIVATLLTGLSIAFLNDSFAITVNEKFMRTVRQLSPQLAAKMRPQTTHVPRGRSSSRRQVQICGQPQWVFVLLLTSASCILWLMSSSLRPFILAFSFGLLGIILHASLRTPNLKARLNTFREEFRSVGRNSSEM